MEESMEAVKSHYQSVCQYIYDLRRENMHFFSLLIPMETDPVETGEFSFGYEYLQMCIKKNAKVVPSQVYNAIVMYLKMMLNYAKEFPKEVEKSVLSLLHMTRQFMTLYSCQDIDLIRQLLLQVQIWRRWPHPIGTLAQDLVCLLYNEIKSLGSAFR